MDLVTERIPAEVFHPSEYIVEELEARGWTRDRLATEMRGEDWGTDRLAIDLYLEIGPTNPGCRLGAMADDLARVFGTSAELWRNLEASWLAHPSTKALEDKDGHGRIG
jgi:HTH-type transcriptional regulator/antitoxin HigA